MNQTDREALEERLEEILHGVENARRTAGFIEDNSHDEQIMGSLTLVREKLEDIENHLSNIIGYTPCAEGLKARV